MYAITLIKEFTVHIVKLIFRSKADEFITGIKKRIHSRNIHTSLLVRKYYSSLPGEQKLLIDVSRGAGSRKRKKPLTVSEYTQRTAVSNRRGHLISQIAGYYKPDLIIELGTSVGVSTMYMAAGSPQSRIITVEGNPQIAEIAADAFRSHQLKQIEVINGLFDDVLPELTRKANSNTMVFIDGNHNRESTLKYVDAFSQVNVIILDDIRWSGDMIKAWNEVTTARPDATVIDLFGMGIIIRGETCRHYHLCL